MEEKVVHMVLEVDPQCHRCYKKVRKILCKIPQIRDQVYDEKQGTVLIKVVSFMPEKIMNKISRKGDRSINSIHFKETEKKNKEDDKEKKKVKKKVRIEELRIVEEPDEEKPKMVDQPDQGNPPPPPPPPPHSISSGPMYEGRPSYQYQDYGISVMPPSSYVGWPIYDSYGREYGEWDRLWGHYVGQSSDNYNQQN